MTRFVEAHTRPKATGPWSLARMSNVLDQQKQQQVLGLGRVGWPVRRIAAATGPCDGSRLFAGRGDPVRGRGRPGTLRAGRPRRWTTARAPIASRHRSGRPGAGAGDSPRQGPVRHGGTADRTGSKSCRQSSSLAGQAPCVSSSVQASSSTRRTKDAGTGHRDWTNSPYRPPCPVCPVCPVETLARSRQTGFGLYLSSRVQSWRRLRAQAVG